MPGRLQKGNISALDTETIGGYAVILSTEHRTWEAHSFEECITPIFSDLAHHNIGSRLMMWNQGYDSQAILKYLPESNLRELLQDNETLYKDRYKIKYVKGKFLSIRDERFKKVFTGYDIAQFFNYMHLEDAGKEYVDQGKYNSIVTECITTNAKLQTDKELFWVFGYHKDEIKHYCHEDALLTQKLAYYISKEIKELYGFDMTSYASKSVIGKVLTRNTVGKHTYVNREGKEKTGTSYPYFMEGSRVGKFATMSYHGGIFDCKKRGAFKNVTDIDISSAYPSHMRSLPNWRNGSFIRITVDELRNTDHYGWIMAKFDYPLIPYTTELDNHWIEVHEGDEIKVSAKNKRKFYPDGERSQPITLIEWRFLKKHGYLLDSEECWVWRHNPNKKQYPDPFTWVDDVYKLKGEIKIKFGKDSYKYSLTKIPMNSAYGSTAQKVGNTEFRNMFYASYITASTRIQICEMLEEVGYDKYITIATDGILIDGDITIPERYTRGGLGSWDVEHYDKALILANGIYYLEAEGKEPKQALRGMLSYDGNLKTAVEKYKDSKDFIPTTKDRPVTMHQAIAWHRYTKDDMNRFIETGRKLSCNTDTTKKWPDIQVFGDLLQKAIVGKRFSIDEVDSL